MPVALANNFGEQPLGGLEGIHFHIVAQRPAGLYAGGIHQHNLFHGRTRSHHYGYSAAEGMAHQHRSFYALHAAELLDETCVLLNTPCLGRFGSVSETRQVEIVHSGTRSGGGIGEHTHRGGLAAPAVHNYHRPRSGATHFHRQRYASYMNSLLFH